MRRGVLPALNNVVYQESDNGSGKPVYVNVTAGPRGQNSFFPRSRCPHDLHTHDPFQRSATYSIFGTPPVRSSSSHNATTVSHSIGDRGGKTLILHTIST
jgi:hypothetical protein